MRRASRIHCRGGESTNHFHTLSGAFVLFASVRIFVLLVQITSVLHSMWFALRPVPRPLGDRSRAGERSETALSALPTMRISSAFSGARHPSQDSSAYCFGAHTGSRPTLRSIRSLRFQQQTRAFNPSASSSSTSTASDFTSSSNCFSDGTACLIFSKYVLYIRFLVNNLCSALKLNEQF